MFDTTREPLFHLERLYQEACAKKVNEPNAMTLATVSRTVSRDSLDSVLQPSARVVYFKGTLRGGLTFYTNYQGRKARDIEFNSQVCTNFYWAELWQQIRIEGRAEKLTRSESEAYFRTRARLSQIGAWASHQSETIPNYEYFQAKMTEYETQFAGQEVPCPPYWGGYLIVPQKYEFWFGQTGRLHERYVHENGQWSMQSP